MHRLQMRGGTLGKVSRVPSGCATEGENERGGKGKWRRVYRWLAGDDGDGVAYESQPGTKTVLLKSGEEGRLLVAARRGGDSGGGAESTVTLRKLKVEPLGEKKRQGSKGGRQKTGR